MSQPSPRTRSMAAAPVAPEAAQAEARRLAAALPAILLDAQRLAAFAAGVHGRRRAGPGEAFWQFRDHQPEDGARLVDWRRSARGDRLYVREREFEAAQAAQFWLDPDPGFAWTSDPARPSKLRRGLTILLAFASLAARGGERVGALGGPARRGAGAVERLATALIGPRPDAPPAPLARSVVLLASDFYAPIEATAAQLARLAQSGASGALLVVSDPAEEDFPFEGRIRFEPLRRGGGTEVVLGRAETARAAYQERLAAHRQELARTARAHGFLAILHRTDAPPAPPLGLLAAALQERRR